MTSDQSCTGREVSTLQWLSLFPGIKSFSVNLDTEQVIVETTLSTGQVQELIENSGQMAILRGLGAPGKRDSSLTLLMISINSDFSDGQFGMHAPFTVNS